MPLTDQYMGKYYKMIMGHATKIENIYQIKTGDDQKIIVGQSGDLYNVQTGTLVEYDDKWKIYWMVRVVIEDASGIKCKLTFFDSYRKIAKESAKSSWIKLKSSNFSLANVYERHLQKLNTNKFQVIIFSSLNKWKDFENITHRNVMMTVNDIEFLEKDDTIFNMY